MHMHTDFSRGRWSRTCVAILAIIGLLSQSVTPLVAAQAAAQTKPAAAKPPATNPGTAGSGAAAPADPDGGWPRAYTTPSGAALIVYQPQVATWVDQKHVTLYAAVSYTTKGAKA